MARVPVWNPPPHPSRPEHSMAASPVSEKVITPFEREVKVCSPQLSLGRGLQLKQSVHRAVMVTCRAYMGSEPFRAGGVPLGLVGLARARCGASVPAIQPPSFPCCPTPSEQALVPGTAALVPEQCQWKERT